MYAPSSATSLVESPERHRRPQSAALRVTPASAVRPPAPSLLTIVGRHRKYLLFCAVIAAAAGVAAGKRFSKETWTYSSTIIHQPPAGTQTTYAPLDVSTLRGMVKSRDALVSLVDEFSLDCPLSALDKLIDVEVPHGGKSIVTTLHWGDPQQAEAMLNRLNELFLQAVGRTRAATLEQLHASHEAGVARARQELVRAQQQLAELRESVGVVDIDKDLGQMSEQIADLESELRKERLSQTTLLAQKKTTNLATVLLINRTEIGQLEGLLAERRKGAEKIKAVRRQMQTLADEVTVAALNRQRAETELAAQDQLRGSLYNELAVIQPARPGLDPVTSNSKKLMLGVFCLCGLLFVIPLGWTELRAWKEHPLTTTARQIGLSVLAAPHSEPGSSPRIRALAPPAAGEYARLLALRIQQCAAKPGYTVLFSGLDRGASPTVLLTSLAKCFAERDHRVLLMDIQAGHDQSFAWEGLLTDSDRKSAATAEPRYGVSNYLTFERPDVDELTLSTVIPDVDCLGAGTTPLPVEGLGTRRMSELFEQLRERYTLILVAGPRVDRSVDLELLAARVDGIVFHTSKSGGPDARAAQAVRHLIELDAPILGVIGC
jgi:Mrp family chromosome partitioning ATPase